MLLKTDKEEGEEFVSYILLQAFQLLPWRAKNEEVLRTERHLLHSQLSNAGN